MDTLPTSWTLHLLQSLPTVTAVGGCVLANALLLIQHHIYSDHVILAIHRISV